MTTLCVERHGLVETWILNRPKFRNALDRELVAALHDAVASAESRGIDAVVIRGAGPSFCAGADLGVLSTFDSKAGQTPRAHLSAIWDLTLAIERSATVYIAVLHGHAVAGGLELALACDIVLAARGTLIGDGHVRNRLIPGGGASVRMARALGPSTTAWLALSGNLLPADDQKLAGWLHSVLEVELLDDAVDEVVRVLLAAPSNARRAYKRILHETCGELTELDRDRELDAFDRHWLSDDVPHALRQFLNSNRERSR